MRSVVLENISKAIMVKDMTQQEVANKSSLSRITINKIFSLRKKSNPTISSLIQICIALDVDFMQLLTRMPDLNIPFNDTMSFEDYMHIFQENLELALRGKNQKSLSSEPGIQESTISSLINKDTSNPTLLTVCFVAQQLNISLENLFKRGGILI